MKDMDESNRMPRVCRYQTPYRLILAKNVRTHRASVCGPLNIGEPASTRYRHNSNNASMDITLYRSAGVKLRSEELQPENDPFIRENIFKSPKKSRCYRPRRRLLSASTVFSTHEERVSKDPSRAIKSKHRRRGILGSKHAASVQQKRSKIRATSRDFREHARSASDPTNSSGAVAVDKGGASGARPVSVCEKPSQASGSNSPGLSDAVSCGNETRPPSFTLVNRKLAKRPPVQYSSALCLSPLPMEVHGKYGGWTARSRTIPYISISALRLVNDVDATLRVPEAAVVRDSVEGPGYAVRPNLDRDLLGLSWSMYPLKPLFRGDDEDGECMYLDCSDRDTASTSRPQSLTYNYVSSVLDPSKNTEDSSGIWSSAIRVLRRLVSCGSV